MRTGPRRRAHACLQEMTRSGVKELDSRPIGDSNLGCLGPAEQNRERRGDGSTDGERPATLGWGPNAIT